MVIEGYRRKTMIEIQVGQVFEVTRGPIDGSGWWIANGGSESECELHIGDKFIILRPTEGREIIQEMYYEASFWGRKFHVDIYWLDNFTTIVS